MTHTQTQGADGAGTKTAGATMILLPMDDPSRPLPYSELPPVMIRAGGDAFTAEAVEAAAATYYDAMMGQEPHIRGWAGKPEAFKAKVRERMALALSAALLTPAPNSTRTGAAETGLPWHSGEISAGSCLYQNKHGAVGYVEGVGSNPGLKRVIKVYGLGAADLRDRIAAALAARPEAPSDAGWSREDLEAFVAREWPEGRSAGAAARELVRALGVRGLAPTLQRLLTDLLGQINFASTDRAQILADFANAAPEAARMAKIDSFERWNPRVFDPTPPSDPAPSGQAEG